MPDNLLTLQQRLSSSVRFRCDVKGATLTTFALGGRLALLAEPHGTGALQELWSFLSSQDDERPPLVIGAGSNLLISDDGLDAPVVHLGREFSGFVVTGAAPLSTKEAAELSPMSGASFLDNGQELSLLVYAATPLMTLSRRVCSAGYTGLEFGAGIPASIGGAVRMNAGAHGGAMSDVLRAIYCVNRRGELERFLVDDLNFGYRTSGLPESSIIFAAQIALRREAREAVIERRNGCLEYRRQTQPLSLPSAGSIFRNPGAGPLDSAGAVLERAGLKGHRVGGVGFSELHANWIVKLDDSARAADVEELIQVAKERVLHQFNLELKPELVIWKPC